jgi:hypothetical protein
MAREAVEIVEIDLPFCQRVYGEGECTAALGTTGAHKCYNLFATCQAQDAFDPDVKTLKFVSRGTTNLPLDETYIPAVVSVSSQPVSINIAGQDPDRGALGRRTTKTITLNDFASSEIGIDPYALERRTGAAQADGVPRFPERLGTFMPKFKLRHLYYEGTALRTTRAFIEDGVIVDAQTTHHFWREWSGPSDGRVTWIASDVFDQVTDEKAQYPRQSRGVLAAGISNSDGAATLDPEGIGEAEYPASGYLTIGSEIVAFTRTGDALTLSQRGVGGTVAAAHNEGDTVQVAVRWENKRIDDAAEEVLAATDIPSSWMPKEEQWEPEITRWASSILLNGWIAKPTGVTGLLNEISLLGVTFIPDEIAQKIWLRCNRPADGTEPVWRLNDDNMVGISATDKPEQRITDVLMYFAPIDPTKGLTEPTNYRIALITPDERNPNAYKVPRVRTVFSRFLGAGQMTAAGIISSRMLNRFRTIPTLRKVRLTSDFRAIALADVARVTTAEALDVNGDDLAAAFQIIAREETEGGEAVEIELQSFAFDRSRYAFFMANDTPAYSAATEQQKSRGAFFIAAAETEFADGGEPYRFI